MLRKVLRKLRSDGIAGMAAAVLPSRPLRNIDKIRSAFEGKVGLEVGGPSKHFRRFLPIYRWASRVDNCNFATDTVWQHRIEPGRTFFFNRKRDPGEQYILEATALAGVPSEHYDFVISSHTLEHVANPVLALCEWLRVLKRSGHLALILPHKDGTFDHRRPVTTLAHMIDDYEKAVTEEDLTHLEEIMELHDLTRSPEVGDRESFRRRSLLNAQNRCLHHHVFDTRSAVTLVDYMGMEVLTVEVRRPYDILIVARRSERAVDNSKVTWTSPFPSDGAS